MSGARRRIKACLILQYDETPTLRCVHKGSRVRNVLKEKYTKHIHENGHEKPKVGKSEMKKMNNWKARRFHLYMCAPTYRKPSWVRTKDQFLTPGLVPRPRCFSIFCEAMISNLMQSHENWKDSSKYMEENALSYHEAENSRSESKNSVSANLVNLLEEKIHQRPRIRTHRYLGYLFGAFPPEIQQREWI